MAPPFAHGLVLGKFMPAHVGHLHLIRFACRLCARVTVVVDRVAGEWPDAAVRADALAADLAGLAVSVRALGRPTPQQPDEHPAFWAFWRDTLLAACGGVPDALVCSMSYGPRLADAIGCPCVPLDLAREGVAVAATPIRADPWAHWRDVLPHARLPYLARVAVEGPASGGRSAVARAAASARGYTLAPEWAADYRAQAVAAGGRADPLMAARGQAAAERSLELVADRALVADTSLLTTMVCARLSHGACPGEVERLFEAEERHAPRRRWLVGPFARSTSAAVRFWEALLEEAGRRGLRYEVIEGDPAARMDRAVALAATLAPPAPT